MTRPLIVLGALVAATACAVWARVSLAPSAPPATSAVRFEIAGPAGTQVGQAEPALPQQTLAVAAPRKAEIQVTRASARTEPKAHAEAMRVALDPATGQIVPPEYSGEALTIEQMQALARREAEGLVTLRNADGSETLNHEGRFADYTILRVGPDGRPVFVCVQGEGAAAHALHARKPVQPKMEDR